ncbi:retroviral-like aspartic protease family protein [Sphingorhabdus sp.]|uniref:retroviral-like aspartic protease family protein n=1 Tax=Sphingorhabdus sp. TaxID=1902408 RepID=UPI003BB20E6D|nr:aspartyl protease family protein [Sphingomonadales bacterium]MBL0022075.1 aspartyl protease family protein [Sphingomonadales bacterium]
MIAATPVCAQDVSGIAPVIPSVETALPITQAFQIDRSERMTVPVRINGSEPIPFIVDTGAERTVIANDLARRLKLEAGPQLKLATITGPAIAESFVIETLAMNTINVEMIEAPGLERQHLGAAGLLGIDSLEDHRVLLDFAARKMDVQASPRKSRPSKAEAGMIIVTATRRAGRMILSNATVGGIKVDIILDTGAQSSMGNYALRDRMRNRDRRFGYVPVIMNSVTGDKLSGDFTQIRNITIGGVNITDLPVTFADNYAFKALNLEKKPAILLGMDAMALFDRVMIDFTNRRVGFDMPRGAQARDPVRIAMAN